MNTIRHDQVFPLIFLLLCILGLTSRIDAQDGCPVGATAICNDGTISYSAHHRGTCSHHGGVAEWCNGSPSPKPRSEGQRPAAGYATPYNSSPPSGGASGYSTSTGNNGAQTYQTSLSVNDATASQPAAAQTSVGAAADTGQGDPNKQVANTGQRDPNKQVANTGQGDPNKQVANTGGSPLLVSLAGLLILTVGLGARSKLRN